MNGKKIISLYLAVVLATQLLPMKQVIKYFLIDNPLTEEITHAEKSPEKSQLQEDEYYNWVIPHYNLITFKYSFSGRGGFNFAESIPDSHSADIHTPPPNIT